MESQQMQQPEYQAPSSKESVLASESALLAKQPSAAQSSQQWQRIATQVAVFLGQLPDLLGKFFNEYQKPIISLGIIIGALIAIRVSFAVLGALNSIPLVAPTFQLVGIGYTLWFVYRYLLKESNRQELSQAIQGFLNKNG